MDPKMKKLVEGILEKKFPDMKFELRNPMQDNRHFELDVESDEEFSKLSRVDQHREIMRALHQEFEDGTVHALRLNIKKNLGDY